MSEWNFSNKLSLLIAEKLSAEGFKIKAEQKYDISIEAAKTSRFIHEEALGNELAGCHYQRNGRIDKAIIYYTRAENLYRDWGALKKVVQVTERIERLKKSKGK
jgi:tetratricopeptide (TPR) repeat protein